MKNFSSILLLVLFLIFSNNFLYFKYIQHKIKQEVKLEIQKNFKNEKLTLIVISRTNNKIKWIEKNKEFKYKDALYDIVKIIKKEEKLYLYCINDKKEEKLIANYLKHNRRQRKTLNKIKKKINIKYFPEKSLTNVKTIKSKLYFNKYINNYKSIYINVDSPPPKHS